MNKQSVLLIGATGETGSHILNGLLESGNFTVIAGVRPSSALNPEVNTLKSCGIEIRILDLENSSVDELVELLKGIDTVISAIFPLLLHLQKPLVDAFKKASVKRLVPCDWGAACIRGVRKMFNDVQNLTFRTTSKKLALDIRLLPLGGATFHWNQDADNPALRRSLQSLPFSGSESLKYRYGTVDIKCAVADVRDFGKFVARIVADDCTPNRSVFCWTQEVTQNEALALAERVSGRKFDIVRLSADGVTNIAKHACWV